MKKFTLCEEALIWDFFDELDISYLAIFQEELQKIIPKLTEEEADTILEELSDDVHNALTDSDLVGEIKSWAVEEFEVEEASGLWGYYTFEIDEESEEISSIKHMTKEAAVVIIDQMMKE